VRFWGSLVFGSALVGVGVAYYVREQSRSTGQSYLEIVRQLPGDARRAYEQGRRRAQLALTDGLRAAGEREHQVQRDLTAAAPRDDVAAV
jgi:hypothetical protein